MDYIIEFIAECIGSITGRCEPEKMPEDLELKTSFVVRSYPKNLILSYLFAIVCIAVSIIAYLGNGIVFACVFLVCGVALLVLGMLLHTGKYAVDEKKIVCTRWFSKTKVVAWESVRFVKRIEQTNESSVTLAFYNEEKLLIDFISPMKNFWYLQKMAEHLGYEIKTEKDPSLKNILHP